MIVLTVRQLVEIRQRVSLALGICPADANLLLRELDSLSAENITLKAALLRVEQQLKEALADV